VDNSAAGILLVGGASRRFGSHKALARVGSETLAERGWRVLGEAFAERVAVGKAEDRISLPFAITDDGTEVRAALAGVVAGLHAVRAPTAVVLPVDCPLVPTELLRELADRCRDAAVTQTGPLPAAFHRKVLPALEQALAERRLAMGDVLAELDVAVVEADPDLLLNVNEPADLLRWPPGPAAPPP
jgi:molybdopterin-guanine dinucleotide biosynthesis protein A